MPLRARMLPPSVQKGRICIPATIVDLRYFERAETEHEAILCPLMDSMGISTLVLL